MSKTHSVVAVCDTHEQADCAIRALQHDGIDMRKLSVVGRDYHTEEHAVGYYNAGDRMWAWGAQGAFWGGLWGVLFGSAFFWIPGLGPILVAGPLVAAIVAGLEGATVVGGIGALGAALASIGIPNNSIVQYEGELKTGKFLVIVQGSPDEIQHAEKLLDKTQLSPKTPGREPAPVVA
ncbi:MAG: permease [Planctomycetota bacterium]|nr:permease [Planctomycetota bacterium]